MSKSALNDVQKAIYAKLTGDTTLTGMITGVFDYSPDNTPFPQVIIGQFMESRWNTFGRAGKNLVATLHVFSDKKGNKEAFTIVDRLNELLDDVTLTLDNHAMVSLQYEDTLIWNDIADDSNSKEIREVQARYRVHVQEL